MNHKDKIKEIEKYFEGPEITPEYLKSAVSLLRHKFGPAPLKIIILGWAGLLFQLVSVWLVWVTVTSWGYWLIPVGGFCFMVYTVLRLSNENERKEMQADVILGILAKYKDDPILCISILTEILLKH